MSADRRIVVLTRRQREVLGQLTRDGADDSTIAARLGLSTWTVKCHVKGILRAFGCPNRTAVVVDCLTGRVAVRVIDNRGGHRWKDTAA